jgi:hypothetical protein
MSEMRKYAQPDFRTRIWWLLFLSVSPVVVFSNFAAVAETPPSPSKPLPGAPQPADQNNPLVLDAKAFIQKQFALMRIEEIKEAHTQIVAGRNVRLVCRVKEEQGEGTWEFVAGRSLSGHWQLLLARRLSD